MERRRRNERKGERPSTGEFWGRRGTQIPGRGRAWGERERLGVPLAARASYAPGEIPRLRCPSYRLAASLL